MRQIAGITFGHTVSGKRIINKRAHHSEIGPTATDGVDTVLPRWQEIANTLRIRNRLNINRPDRTHRFSRSIIDPKRHTVKCLSEASKTEYYDRIISSLQSEITSQKSEISDLKSTVARQQKEIEALKASQGVPQKSSELQQKWITTENLLLVVKRVCDDVILNHYEQLPTMFADRQEFESFRKSTEQKFLAVETFASYKKSLEMRLKSIEEKLGKGFCLLAINLYNQKRDKGYKSVLNVIKNLKDIEFEGFLPFVAFLSLAMFALYLISSITN